MARGNDDADELSNEIIAKEDIRAYFINLHIQYDL